MKTLAVGLSVGLLLTAACSSKGSGTGGTAGSAAGTGGSDAGGRPADPPITVSLQGRTYDIYLPPALGGNPDEPLDAGLAGGGAGGGTGGASGGFDGGGTPVPLLLELHGFVDSTDTMTPWFDEEMANGFKAEAASRGIILVLPHGTIDPTLDYFFWNATNSCCDLDKIGTNDIGYLMAIIQDVSVKYPVDPKRIFAFGHSNGGFMINRMACDQADKIAAVVSLARETYTHHTLCAASAPIAYLQVQGDADMTVPYDGGPPEGIAVLPPAPGAVQTTKDWAAKNLCNPTGDTSQPQITLMAASTAPDTAKVVYDGCEANGDTELWTIHNGPHSPDFNASWAPAVFDFLLAHPKP
jgi:polyhydroxybutyrate depolymerase